MNKRWCTFGGTVLVLATTLSLAFNVYIFRRAEGYYRQLSEVSLDPLGLSQYNSESQAATQKRVVFVGDSRAAEWPAPSVEGFEFVNRGIGNQTTAQVLGRFSTHISPLHPTIVVIQVGINNLKTIPLFHERRDRIVLDCKDHLRQLVDQSTALGATVIVTTIFPVGPVPLERQLFWSSEVANSVDEVNDFVRSLEAPNVIVFDTFALLADENGTTQSSYARDTLHLTVEGYTALNMALSELLSSLP